MNTEAYRPHFLSSAAELEQLMRERPHVTVVDAFERQLRELFLIQKKQFIGASKESAYQSAEYRSYQDQNAAAFIHIYFPWNERVVKCVHAEDYLALKTDRNQDLITAAEQRTLYDFPVAVLGLSVGSNIVFVLTQAGISREITIADLDELDATNLNRILAGVHEIGLPKTTVAARHIYEDNPFADVNVLSEGVSVENLEPLLRGGKVKCIIEELDDIPLKIDIRELAMKYRVPVVMITDNGDGIVLHIERYDLGHDKIWGKPVDYYRAKIQSRKLTKEEAGQIIIGDIVGGPDRVDPRMMASVGRVLQRELVSWSQLGSAAILAGVVCTYWIKQIALGLDSRPDIRAYISPTDIRYGTHQS